MLTQRISQAVRSYARIEIEGLTRRAIHRLQRIEASGIYGDGYAFKSLWDEWCHEKQEGPHDLLDSAWEQTLSPIVDELLDSIPHHAAVLLSVYAAWELGVEDDTTLIGSFWPEGIRQVFRDRLDREAGGRRLDHLGPWRNG